MSKPFTFPPPPPPPPKPSSNQGPYQQQNSRGGYQGHQGHQGRGAYPSSQQQIRGGNNGARHPSRGSYRGGGRGSRENGVNGLSAGPSSSNRNESWQNGDRGSVSQYGGQTGNFNPPQKRPHSTAFNGQSTATQMIQRSRPLAPPPVPSFGIDFDTLLPKKPEQAAAVNAPSQSAPVRKMNLLGLTPALQTSGADSDSESDAEEEAKLATAMSTNTNSLTFEYNGQAASLSTPEEIASWIAERRKKWPTEAKREIARQQAEERRQKYAAEKLSRLEASKAAAKARQIQREKQKTDKEKSLLRQKMLREQIAKASSKAKGKENTDHSQTPAQIKAERLKQKAARLAQRLQKAESALEKETQNIAVKSNEAIRGPTDGQEVTGETEENNIDSLLAQVDKLAAAQQDLTPISSHDAVDDSTDDTESSGGDLEGQPDDQLADDTSTSGSSSDSDSDDAPEELSSKQTSAISPARAPRQDTRPLCTNYTKTGRCKFGRRCHYRHEKVVRDKAGGQQGKEIGQRKGLYQVMVEKELESERKRALNVIIGLGEGGWLDEVDDRNVQNGGI